jgi:hypothetical protein
MKTNHNLGFCLILALCACRARSQQTTNAIYQNPKASTSDRVHDLLNCLTLEEKVARLRTP